MTSVPIVSSRAECGGLPVHPIELSLEEYCNMLGVHFQASSSIRHDFGSVSLGQSLSKVHGRSRSRSQPCQPHPPLNPFWGFCFPTLHLLSPFHHPSMLVSPFTLYEGKKSAGSSPGSPCCELLDTGLFAYPL